MPGRSQTVPQGLNISHNVLQLLLRSLCIDAILHHDREDVLYGLINCYLVLLGLNRLDSRKDNHFLGTYPQGKLKGKTKHRIPDFLTILLMGEPSADILSRSLQTVFEVKRLNDLKGQETNFLENKLNHGYLAEQAFLVLIRRDTVRQILWQGYMGMKSPGRKPDQGVEYIHIIGFYFSVFHFPPRQLIDGEEGQCNLDDLRYLYRDPSTHPLPKAVCCPMFADTSKHGFAFSDEFMYATRGDVDVSQCGLFIPQAQLAALPEDQAQIAEFNSSVHTVLDRIHEGTPSPASSESAENAPASPEYTPDYAPSDYQYSPMITRRRSEASLRLDSEGDDNADDDEDHDGEDEGQGHDDDEEEGSNEVESEDEDMSFEMARPGSSMSM